MAYFLFCDTGPLVRLHSKINATVYKEILKKHVPNLRTEFSQPAVFMQDNAQRANSVKTFLSEKDVTIIEWLAQSLDMNPIDNVWKLINKKVNENYKKCRRTME